MRIIDGLFKSIATLHPRSLSDTSRLVSDWGNHIFKNPNSVLLSSIDKVKRR